MKLGSLVKRIGLVAGLGVFLAACSHDVPKGSVREVVPTPTYNPTQDQTSQNYTDYSKAAFDQARSEGKIILVYFYANWCPTCRAQQPANDQAFAQLADNPQVAVFVSNFNDSEETGEDKALQKEFDIPYQHTFLVINAEGEVTYKYTGQLAAEEIVSRVNEAK